MLTFTNFVVFGVGAAVLIAWLVFYAVGYKEAAFFSPLSEKEFFLKEIYFVGHAVTKLIRYNYTSKNDRKLRRDLAVIYGDKYADYYLRVIWAQKITMGFTVAVLAFILYGLSNNLSILFVMLVLAGTVYYYFQTVTSKKILKRSEELLRDFSEVISKLALLTNAGMILREAWEDTASTRDTAIYKEMQKAVIEMNNGIAEVDALSRFGLRCRIPEIKKFTSTVIQGLVKGNAELTFLLAQQSREVWSAKKQDIRRQGEKAASKLLIPICIMFIGILVMLIVPIFAGIGSDL